MTKFRKAESNVLHLANDSLKTTDTMSANPFFAVCAASVLKDEKSAPLCFSKCRYSSRRSFRPRPSNPHRPFPYFRDRQQAPAFRCQHHMNPRTFPAACLSSAQVQWYPSDYSPRPEHPWQERRCRCLFVCTCRCESGTPLLRLAGSYKQKADPGPPFPTSECAETPPFASWQRLWGPHQRRRSYLGSIRPWQAC